MTPPSLGCARCGTCCDPVLLAPEAAAAIDGTAASGDTETVTFAAEHWRQQGEPDEDGWVSYTCDQFDPDTRLCKAGESRPPVCRHFPWYLGPPTPARAAGLHPQCSYLLDVAPEDRPEGSRPLIPVEALTR